MFTGYPMPEGFTFLLDVDPTIIERSRYLSVENFMGRSVPGYTTPKVICTKAAAEALKTAHTYLKAQGYKLVVYDAYRPQRAVDAFIKWSEDPRDQVNKKLYYPTVKKEEVFALGYLAKKSGHSRGSTVDLTIIPYKQTLRDITVRSRMLSNGEQIPFLDDGSVDMGSSFDLLHEVSSHDSPLVTEAQNKMRNFLRKVMKQHGFKEYQKEWWHYTLENEPYPDQYFDFVVDPA